MQRWQVVVGESGVGKVVGKGLHVVHAHETVFQRGPVIITTVLSALRAVPRNDIGHLVAAVEVGKSIDGLTWNIAANEGLDEAVGTASGLVVCHHMISVSVRPQHANRSCRPLAGLGIGHHGYDAVGSAYDDAVEFSQRSTADRRVGIYPRQTDSHSAFLSRCSRQRVDALRSCQYTWSVRGIEAHSPVALAVVHAAADDSEERSCTGGGVHLVEVVDVRAILLHSPIEFIRTAVETHRRECHARAHSRGSHLVTTARGYVVGAENAVAGDIVHRAVGSNTEGTGIETEVGDDRLELSRLQVDGAEH